MISLCIKLVYLVQFSKSPRVSSRPCECRFEQRRELLDIINSAGRECGDGAGIGQVLKQN